MSQEILEKSSIGLPSFGKPTFATGAKEGDSVPLGLLIGQVHAIGNRTDAREGTSYNVLSGAFKIIPVDQETPAVRAKILNLPGAAMTAIVDQVKKVKGGFYEFAYRVDAVVAKNAAGFTFGFSPLLHEISDPLADLEERAKAAKPARGKAA